MTPRELTLCLLSLSWSDGLEIDEPIVVLSVAVRSGRVEEELYERKREREGEGENETDRNWF